MIFHGTFYNQILFYGIKFTLGTFEKYKMTMDDFPFNVLQAFFSLVSNLHSGQLRQENATCQGLEIIYLKIDEIVN